MPSTRRSASKALDLDENSATAPCPAKRAKMASKKKKNAPLVDDCVNEMVETNNCSDIVMQGPSNKKISPAADKSPSSNGVPCLQAIETAAATVLKEESVNIARMTTDGEGSVVDDVPGVTDMECAALQKIAHHTVSEVDNKPEVEDDTEWMKHAVDERENLIEVDVKTCCLVSLRELCRRESSSFIEDVGVEKKNAFRVTHKLLYSVSAHLNKRYPIPPSKQCAIITSSFHLLHLLLTSDQLKDNDNLETFLIASIFLSRKAQGSFLSVARLIKSIHPRVQDRFSGLYHIDPPTIDMVCKVEYLLLQKIQFDLNNLSNPLEDVMYWYSAGLISHNILARCSQLFFTTNFLFEQRKGDMTGCALCIDYPSRVTAFCYVLLALFDLKEYNANLESDGTTGDRRVMPGQGQESKWPPWPATDVSLSGLFDTLQMESFYADGSILEIFQFLRTHNPQWPDIIAKIEEFLFLFTSNADGQDEDGECDEYSQVKWAYLFPTNTTNNLLWNRNIEDVCFHFPILSCVHPVSVRGGGGAVSAAGSTSTDHHTPVIDSTQTRITPAMSVTSASQKILGTEEGGPYFSLSMYPITLPEPSVAVEETSSVSASSVEPLKVHLYTPQMQGTSPLDRQHSHTTNSSIPEPHSWGWDSTPPHNQQQQPRYQPESSSSHISRYPPESSSHNQKQPSKRTSTSQSTNKYRVFCGNLSDKTTESDLKDFFSGCGIILDALHCPNKPFGFVVFTTLDAFERAIDLSGKDLWDRPINVKPAVEQSNNEANHGPPRHQGSSHNQQQQTRYQSESSYRSQQQQSRYQSESSYHSQQQQSRYQSESSYHSQQQQSRYQSESLSHNQQQQSRVPQFKIYCKIPGGTNEIDIKDFFGPCGRIIDVYVKDQHHLSFAFVVFDSQAAALKAIDKQDELFRNSRIAVRWAETSSYRVAGGHGGGVHQRTPPPHRMGNPPLPSQPSSSSAGRRDDTRRSSGIFTSDTGVVSTVTDTDTVWGWG